MVTKALNQHQQASHQCLPGCGVALQAGRVLLSHGSSFYSSWRNPLSNTLGELQKSSEGQAQPTAYRADAPGQGAGAGQ